MQRRRQTLFAEEKVKMKDATNTVLSKIVQGKFADVYEVSAEIGRGKFAVVKRCTNKSLGIEYAAKFLKKRRKGRDCKKEILHEIQMLELALSHPRIISLVEVYETSHDLIIITHFAKGGELFETINAESQLDEKVTMRLMSQILDGISFLHVNNIAHLDVKPQNILLTEALPRGDIKLCDFGLARFVNCGHDILEIIGTPDYVAPEVLDYKPLNYACDMWSIGVLTYVMLTGCSPFAGDTTQETYLNISQVNLDFPEDLFGGISKEAIDFMQSLLLKNPSDRMTAHQALDHVWLQRKDTVVIPTVSPSESPSGQRRSILTMKNPDFHKPIKKSRCDQNVEKENISLSQSLDNYGAEIISKPVSTKLDECLVKIECSSKIDLVINSTTDLANSSTIELVKSSTLELIINSSSSVDVDNYPRNDDILKSSVTDLVKSVTSNLGDRNHQSENLKCCDDCVKFVLNQSSVGHVKEDVDPIEKRELTEVTVRV